MTTGAVNGLCRLWPAGVLMEMSDRAGVAPLRGAEKFCAWVPGRRSDRPRETRGRSMALPRAMYFEP
jgi:hypothetical protein